MFKNILVATEFNVNYHKLIDYAKEIASKFDAKIWIIHVIAPESDFVGYGMEPLYIPDFKDDKIKEEHRLLKNIVEELQLAGVSSDGLILEGATTERILEECNKLKIDLICMGHRNYGWIHQLLAKHVDIDVIEHSKSPFLPYHW